MKKEKGNQRNFAGQCSLRDPHVTIQLWPASDALEDVRKDPRPNVIKLGGTLDEQESRKPEGLARHGEHMRVLPLSTHTRKRTQCAIPQVVFPSFSSSCSRSGSFRVPSAQLTPLPISSAHNLFAHGKIFLMLRIHFFRDAVEQVRQEPA